MMLGYHLFAGQQGANKISNRPSWLTCLKVGCISSIGGNANRIKSHTWHKAPYPWSDTSLNITIHDVTLPRGIPSDNKEGFPQWIRARMHNGVIEICLFKCRMAFSPVLCIHLWNVCIKTRPIRMTKRKKLQSIAHKIVWRTHSVGAHARHHSKQTVRIPSNTWGPFFVRHLLHLRWFERFQIF